jgi:signal transduction histidine kinase/CheY-like chemotaxis protein
MLSMTAVSLLFMVASLVALAAAVLFVRKALRAQRRAETEQERLRNEVRALKSAASALDKAEAASEAKSRFLATVSHEVRTPLNGILGMTGLLASTSLTAEQSSYLEAIRASGASLSSLINEILDFSKIEAGRLELQLAPFDLPALAEGVVELLAPRAQGKGIEIASWIDSKTPRMVTGDSGRLRQVLINLAGNAVKFTQSGGVGLRVDMLDEGKLRFTVSDTGPGVPFERRQTIFQEFEQADGSPTRQHEGTGLGLAISRRLVALMGGDLRLERAGSDGSVFAFVVPFSEAGPGSIKNFQKGLSGRRALVVAASPFGGPYLAERLLEFGVEVTRAEGEAAAVDALKQTEGRALDLVIVDCALGEAATQRLASAARAHGAAKSLVLFSPFERRAFGEAIVHDFDGWLVKPVRLESLYARLNSKMSTSADRGGASPQVEAPALLSGRRILLAEDNEVNALLVESHLRRLGAEVVRAHDGVEAVEKAQGAISGEEKRFDAVLMDIRMPRLDGLAAAQLVRAAEAKAGAPRTRMIALTANAFDEDRRAALDAGLDDFLTKPVDLDAVAEAISSPRRADQADRKQLLE